jgi:Mn-dependent DtxR family transcriptional regulator
MQRYPNNFRLTKIKLLWIISQSVPFMPKITDLAKELEVSRNSLLNYLIILEWGGLINLLQIRTPNDLTLI